MIRVFPLAAVLAASIAAAGDPGAVRVTGSVLTEKPTDAVSVRVFAVGDAVVDRPALLREPLAEATQKPGPFALALDPAWFPVRVEVAASGHLAASAELLDARPRALAPLWLPAGKTVRVRVIAAGGGSAGVLVSGDLEGGTLSAEAAWRAVIPTRETDAAGAVEAVVPATGRVALSALAADGRWGRSEAALPSPADLRCPLSSRPLPIVVRNPKGEPIAGARAAAVGAPAGAVSVTDAGGRARVQIAETGSSAVIAASGSCAARGVAFPGARADLVLTCAPAPTLSVSWVGGSDAAVARAAWLPAALSGGGVLRLSGRRGTVPYFGHGGNLDAWSTGAAPQRIEVEEGATGATIRFAAAAAVDGSVVDAAERPVAGVPVWLWTLPEMALSGRMRGARGADMLERSVLPGSVSDANGTFALASLVPALTRLVARHPGNPPADSGPLDLAPGRRQQVTLRLEAGTWVALAVTDPDGRALAGVAASVAPNPDAHGGRMVIRLGGGDRSVTERLAEGVTDRDGKVLLSGVRPGAMKLRLKLAGYVERSLDVEVPAQGLDAGVQVLEPGVTVLGRVVDEHGVGIADAQIRSGSMLGSFGPAATTSDATGAFAVADLPREGETYLSAGRGDGSRSESVRVALPPQGPVELVIKGRRVLTGRVVDESTAAPVSGALVHAQRSMTMQTGGGGMTFAVRMIDQTDDVETDGEGRFRLEGVTAGAEYTLEASAQAYRPVEQKVKIPEDEPPRPLTVLLKPGLSVRGIVREPTGEPAPGVVVEAEPATRSGGIAFRDRSTTARSGDDGTFVVEGLEPGSFELRATAEDGATAREVAEAGREEPVELQLEGTGAIDGRVVTDDGSPAGDATVSAFSGSFNQLDPVKVDGGGGFTMPRVTPGQYQVTAEADGFARASAQTTVQSGRAASVTLTLKRGGTVNGRILGLGAKELERCQVFSRGSRGTPSPDGTFTLTGVPLGPGEVGAFVLPDGKRRSVPVDIEDVSQPADVELDFGKGAHLSGTVRRGGSGVSGVIVEAAASGGGASGSTTTTDAQGRWELAGVEPGPVEVRALDRQGNVLAARALTVSGDARVDLEVPGGRLVGKVVALPDRSPITGARVTATGVGAAAVNRETRTDQSGAFVLEELPDGDLQVRGESEGYAPAEARVSVSMGAARDLTLELEEEKRLRLVVREEDGSVPDQVMLLPVLAGRVGDPVWATCDRNGRASVGSLPAGGYTFLISGAGEALVALAVPSTETGVTLRSTGTVRAVTTAGESWRVRVVSVETGLAVPVGPWQNASRGEWTEVRDGVLALRVPAGSYAVQAVAPDGATREKRVVIPPEGDVIAAL